MNKAKLQVNINPEVSVDAVVLPNGDTIKKGEIALLVIAGLPLLIEDSSDEEE